MSMKAFVTLGLLTALAFNTATTAAVALSWKVAGKELTHAEPIKEATAVYKRFEIDGRFNEVACNSLKMKASEIEGRTGMKGESFHMYNCSVPNEASCEIENHEVRSPEFTAKLEPGPKLRIESKALGVALFVAKVSTIPGSMTTCLQEGTNSFSGSITSSKPT